MKVWNIIPSSLHFVDIWANVKVGANGSDHSE